jgi:hypothetical protein
MIFDTINPDQTESICAFQKEGKYRVIIEA